MPQAAWAVLLYAVFLVSGVGRAAAQCDAGHTSTQCCLADRYEDTILLNNVPRTYSSVEFDTGIVSAESELGYMLNRRAWIPATHAAGEYIEIDLLTPSRIVRVVTQGRGNSLWHVKTFTLQYRVSTSHSWVAPLTTYTNINGNTQIHTLPTPVYARYIRIVMQTFNSEPAMRAGVVVTKCVDPVAQCDARSTMTHCICNANNYLETIVLNPPEIARSFSTEAVFLDSGRHLPITSMLDTFAGTVGWSPLTDTSGEWLQIDTIQENYVTGIITQGRFPSWPTFLFQWVSQFRVEYQDVAGVTRIIGTFSSPNANKIMHQFTSPIFSKSIRIVALQRTNRMAMRVALVVQTCLACIDGAVSANDSVSEAACQCSSNRFLDQTLANRAIAIMPGSSLFSSLIQRTAHTSGSTAVWDSTAGPPTGRGAVMFDLKLLQYLDAGVHRFNIAANFGGLTVVGVFMFTGPSRTFAESLFEFAGRSDAGQAMEIRVHRDASRGKLEARITWGYNFCSVNQDTALLQDTWEKFVVTYDSMSLTLKLTVGSNQKSNDCYDNFPSFTATKTFIGGNHSYFTGSVAGLYAVDAVLSATQITKIAARMYTGQDVLQACEACIEPSTSPQGSIGSNTCVLTCPSNAQKSLDGSACICNAGFEDSAGFQCAACTNGKYAGGAGAACTACPGDYTSPPAAIAIGMCACGPGSEDANPADTTCRTCPLNTYNNGVEGLCIPVPTNAFTTDSITFICNAGYSHPLVSNACSACAAGTYKEAAGNDVALCATCKQFSESASATINAENCRCVQGFGVEGNPLDSCVACVKGKYRAGVANAPCVLCPAGSTTLNEQAFDLSQCVAALGFQKISGLFQACPAGSFKPQEGDAACTPCPTYSTTPAAGAVASSECVCAAPRYQAFGSGCGCAPGFRYVAASLTCEPCPADSFCLGTQADGALVTTTATPCPTNSVSDAGGESQAACACKPGYTGANTACAQCPANSFKAGTGPGNCEPCRSDSTSGAGSASAQFCLCNAGFGLVNAGCELCPVNTYRTFVLSPSDLQQCVPCTGLSNSEAGSESAAACACNAGYAKSSTNSGACTACAAGTYWYQQTPSAVDIVMENHIPYITSLAKDWNADTGSFDSLCAGQTCAGNTGASSAGTVSHGYVSGHAAGAPVAFVGGDTATKMEWGANSIPTDFTVCSVVRYTSTDVFNQNRILTDLGGISGNPESTTWLHSHFGGLIGIVNYGIETMDMAGSYPGSPTDWVVVCGRNKVEAGAAGVYMNGVQRQGALNGKGGRALGINIWEDTWEDSDWQLSKLYIWDYHIPNNAFALIALALTAELQGNTADLQAAHASANSMYVSHPIPSCGACPASSTSAVASPSILSCECLPGHTGANGQQCVACAAGTYTETPMPALTCTACPPNTISPPTSGTLSACACNSGYTGPDGGTCTPCAQNEFKASTGSASCTPCSSNAQSPAASNISTACRCNAGYSGNDGAACSACEAGTYKTGAGPGTCTPCDSDRSSPAGSTIANACVCNALHGSQADISSPTGTICVLCGQNTVKLNTSSTCQCVAGYTGPDNTACTMCAAGKYKIALGDAACSNCSAGQYSTVAGAASNVCQGCPSNSNAPESSDEEADCTCNAGFSRDVGGLCIACVAGKYKIASGNAACSECLAGKYSTAVGATSDVCQACPSNSNSPTASDEATDCACQEGLYKINPMDEMLRRNKPYITSLAKDWNVATKRFDSLCAGQACEGDTGALAEGTASTGFVSNNGAGASVQFVGGTQQTKMQWGAGSIPTQFTICSVVRYVGPQLQRILTGYYNPLGYINWLHGHHAGDAGSVMYGHAPAENEQGYLYSIAIKTNWVVACGRNLVEQGAVGAIVNGVETRDAVGGVGGGALGINFHSQSASEWQLSKLYIWNYHLSNSDFQLASSYFYSELQSSVIPHTTAEVCSACLPNSNSPSNSSSASACTCNAGFTGPDGGACAACPAGSFKNETGPGACELCPAFSSSANASTHRTNCTCGAGYKGVPGGTCGKICPPGAEHGPLNQLCYACNTSTYKPLAGDHRCTPCPAFSHHALTNQTRIEACLCQIGYLWNATAQGCSRCPANTFNSRAGDVGCFACCPSASSNGASCSEFPVVPAGYQATALGGNFEPCPVNTYNNASVLVCTPARFYAVLEADVAVKTGVSGWRFVRFLPTTSTQGHPATDWLQGTEVYGNPNILTASWSVLFGEFDQFFMTQANSKWAYFNRAEIQWLFSDRIGRACCSQRSINLLKTSGSSTPSTGTAGHASVNGIQILTDGTIYPYIDNRDGRHATRGSSVFVRNSAASAGQETPPCQACPSPSTYTARGGLASVAECECAAGYSRNANNTCAACAVGSFKAGTGDAPCVQCLGNTTTLEPASASIAECVCEVDFEPVGGVCRACTPPTAKLNPGNEACIGCGPNSALDPDDGHNNQTSCECLAGHAGDWRGCEACLRGFYKSEAGARQCSACAAYATTAQNASTDISQCFCAPPELWEPGPLGPNVSNGSCVALCAAGSRGSAGVCNLCATGTYKPVTGSAACSACTAPFLASLAGSVLASACTCPAGLLDNQGTEYVYVTSIGALSEADLDVSTMCANYGDGMPCVVAANPALRMRSLRLSAAAGGKLRDVTVQVTRRGSRLTIFACTSECVENSEIKLHGWPGVLIITSSGLGSAVLTRHTRRTAVLSVVPTMITQAEAEKAVLRHDLRVGDAMWVDVQGGPKTCEPCPLGVVCP